MKIKPLTIHGKLFDAQMTDANGKPSGNKLKDGESVPVDMYLKLISGFATLEVDQKAYAHEKKKLITINASSNPPHVKTAMPKRRKGLQAAVMCKEDSAPKNLNFRFYRKEKESGKPGNANAYVVNVYMGK